jgi:hypothetical protein
VLDAQLSIEGFDFTRRLAPRCRLATGRDLRNAVLRNGCIAATTAWSAAERAGGVADTAMVIANLAANHWLSPTVDQTTHFMRALATTATCWPTRAWFASG